MNATARTLKAELVAGLASLTKTRGEREQGQELEWEPGQGWAVRVVQDPRVP
jgi:hypothetical protein